MSDNERPRQHPKVETHLLPDGTCLLFDNRTEMGHVLNAVAALVWDYCDGSLAEEEIADEVAALLPDEQFVRDDVMQLLADLKRLDLLQKLPMSSPSMHTGVTRVDAFADVLER
ncbi:MAG: PqqD family protein [Ktedonobacterales bacterium]